MNFWENMWSPIRSWFGGSQASGTQTTGPGGYGYSAAVTVTEETAWQVSAVWACVRLLSQTVASLPILLYRRTPSGRELVTDHWFNKLMERPNKYQTRYEFWEYQIANLALHGNFYNRISRIGNNPIGSLMPLNPLQVEVQLVNGKVVYLFTMDGGVNVYAEDNVWQARMNADFLVGRSPLQYGRSMIGVAQAAEKAVTSIYANGGKRSGVISFDRILTPDQRSQIKTNFSGLTEGDDRLLVLESSGKFEPVAMSPQDIELLASRRFQTEEIARWFGVPSVLINDTSGSTTWGSGIEQIVAGFYKLNLRPYLEAIENSITTHLLNDEERKQYEVEFDFEGLLRSDQKTRFEGYRTAIQSGIMTPNEARGLEWMKPMPGGEVLYMQGATVPIEELGQTGVMPKPIKPAAPVEGVTNDH